jgi:glutathione S-transferase
MMVTVLRRLHGSNMLNEQSSLADYIARGEARPAFRRAIAAQKADFDASSAATTGKGQAE